MNERGPTYLEVLVGSLLLLFALLTVTGMFITGYASVNSAGNTTMGLSATRQLMEDIRRLPFDSLANMDDFNTDDPNTLPASGPEREVARRWRYALAGDGVGWTFTDEEQARWTNLSDQGEALNGVGTINVTAQSATVSEVSVTVSVPGTWRDMRITTLIARL